MGFTFLRLTQGRTNNDADFQWVKHEPMNCSAYSHAHKLSYDVDFLPVRDAYTLCLIPPLGASDYNMDYFYLVRGSWKGWNNKKKSFEQMTA